MLGSPIDLVGMVAAFPLTYAPPGWLVCNGTFVSKTTYSNLYNRIGPSCQQNPTQFKLPDLRGLFIRGYHMGSNAYETDVARGINSLQGDAFRDHTHDLFIRETSSGDFDTSGGDSGGVNHSKGETKGANGSGTGPETRPKNLALLYCIKY